MKKILKVLVAVEFILILAIIGLNLTDAKKMPTAYAVKVGSSLEKNNFKMSTKAVCNEKAEHIFCHDELFLRCNNKEFVINEDYTDNLTECNVNLNLSHIMVNGASEFRKDWNDTRKKNIIGITQNLLTSNFEQEQ